MTIVKHIHLKLLKTIYHYSKTNELPISNEAIKKFSDFRKEKGF